LSSLRSFVANQNSASSAFSNMKHHSQSPLITKIAIVGQGYVGLPLSLQFARSGVSVIGLDVDTVKVNALNQGRSYIKHVASDAIKIQREEGRFEASNDFSRIRDVEAVIICVPTPSTRTASPTSPISSRRARPSPASAKGRLGRAGVYHLPGHDRRGPARGDRGWL